MMAERSPMEQDLRAAEDALRGVDAGFGRAATLAAASQQHD